MAVKMMGAGAKIALRLIELNSGSEAKPWIVYRYDDAGIWPIESFATEELAEARADELTVAERQRHEAINEQRREAGRPELPAYLFDDFFVRHKDNPL